jgi:hypothetical protein
MRTEKTGVVIYYKHLKILEEAQLTDEQIGQIFRAAIKYDETGESPQFSGLLSAFFAMIKYDLDANREKWEEIKEARSKAGKKGGRPTNEANLPIGKGESKETNRFLGDVEAIKNEARNYGFFIDNSKAQIFSNCGLSPEWLRSPHSFLEFAAERVEENYSDKPESEQKKLFIDAVKNWEELREEYPEWKAKKEKQEQKAEREAEIEKVKNYPPSECGLCGGEVVQLFGGDLHCTRCEAVGSFDAEKIKWVWRE